MEREAGIWSPISPVEDYIQELVRFTLYLSSKAKLQTGLTTHYCAKLLIHDHHDQPFLNPSNNNNNGGGVPSYPLYKRLASSIYQSIYSGSGSGSQPIHNILIQQKKKNWDDFIVNKGHALINMLKDVDFELHVQEPFFSQLYEGVKTVEGRCAVGDYKRMKPGDLLLFNKCLILQVQDVHQYASFHEMLEVESLARVLPGVTTIEEGVQIYRKFYSEVKENSNGVIGICVKAPTSQLYSIMASLLSGLSYGGIQYVLGFANTAGTNQDLLPPATSTLLKTFMAPHNPHVKGSTLTDGARALAKHVDRSSKGYWGSLHGNVHRISGTIHGEWIFKGMEALISSLIIITIRIICI